ncbi:hypothetical protein FOQG_15720 [Fusarium oxysporum f. sp. raphani 54005]|uniref:Uncharacterized protein n=2 Tax=Fusarium oxysporum TaxID=5507 RepID=X0BMM6_FUSOX|nr:hypothetical protein FOVG_17587 [Fusarium oxysporum f. sp. pisi HDV247]EXK79694.1 hypothetical protein FOQG_15720 [Fusarium oxysporum f. sp. raphani 54005]
MPTMASSTERVPGLNCPVTADTVDKSREIHDLLPKDTDRPSPETHLPSLTKILVTYNVHEKYGFHKPHRHLDELGENRILLGTTLTEPLLCRWTRAQHIDDIDLNEIHAHILVFYQGKLVPYEYHKGLHTGNIPKECLDELLQYFEKHSLCFEFALQALLPEFTGRLMSEIDLGNQTLMLEAKYLNCLKPGNTTGWIVSPQGCTVGETHGTAPDGTHVTVNKGAPLPDDLSGICKLLIEQDLVHSHCLTA